MSVRLEEQGSGHADKTGGKAMIIACLAKARRGGIKYMYAMAKRECDFAH